MPKPGKGVREFPKPPRQPKKKPKKRKRTPSVRY